MERDGGDTTGLDRALNFNSHAHVERDDFGHWNVVDYCDFNSHAHVERDLREISNNILGANISTHTLTWSVTAATPQVLTGH